MLPDQILSTTTFADDFLAPRNRAKEPLVDYALGGAGIQDPSEGLQLYHWRGRYVGGSIVLDVPSFVDPVTVLTIANVTEFQFTFDQNMQPFIGYSLADGSAHYYWFDPTEDDFVTVDLPEGSFSVRCMLDDARDAAGTVAGASDIILTYLRSGKLYFRAQSDRFGTEYLLKSSGLDTYEIGQFGMNRLLRMQWQMVPTVKNPKPSITSISPTSADTGGAAFSLTVNGVNFTRQSVVRWNGDNRTTHYVSPTQITADILAADIASMGSVDVTVFNPPPGGGESSAATFEVEGNPEPTIVSIDPTTAAAGGSAFTLTVTGTGFVDGDSVVRWNGNARTTTFVSETELEAEILETDIEEGGSAEVTVFNPAPGGGESNALTFTVTEVTEWTPAEISTALWLDASDSDTITLVDGAVSQWDDKSGNDRHAMQPTAANRPTVADAAYNGLDALRFDGANDSLEADSIPTGASAYSLYTVLKVDNDPAAAAISAGSWRFTGDTSSQRSHHPWTDGVLYHNFGSTTRKTVGNPSFNLTQLHLFNIDSAANDWKARLNATQLFSTSSNTVGMMSDGRGLIGASSLTSTFHFLNGDICEFIVCASVLDEATRQKMEGYLAWKWGIEGNLPADHPYKDAPPTVGEPAS